MIRAMLDLHRKRFIAAPMVGRRLRGLITQLGYEDVNQDGWIRMFRGDEPEMRIYSLLFEIAAKVLIPAGMFTEEKYSNVQRLLGDSTHDWVGPVMFGAWGRKPVAGQ